MWCPLTALLKKNGGVHPIAVGEILHRLASRLCCEFAFPFLSDFFLPYGQVDVGIPGDLEVAIHAVHHSLSQFGNDESLALLKIDMKKAFNECNRSAFLDGVCKEFPEISPWMYWCYSQPAELWFGHRCILASTGVFLLPQVSNREILLVPNFFLWCWCNFFVPSLLVKHVLLTCGI